MTHRGSIACIASFLLAAPGARGEGGPPAADDLTLVALAVGLSCGAEEGNAPPRREAPAGDPADAPPRAEIAATVRARSLRFDAVPEAEPLLAIARRTTWRAERLNLPARPEPGVVYRDVEVRLSVAGDLDDLTALLSEAKRASAALRLEPAPREGAPSEAAPGERAPSGDVSR